MRKVINRIFIFTEKRGTYSRRENLKASQKSEETSFSDFNR